MNISQLLLAAAALALPLIAEGQTKVVTEPVRPLPPAIVTPVPVTPAPVTPVPVTPVPVTPIAPATSAPVVTAPATAPVRGAAPIPVVPASPPVTALTPAPPAAAESVVTGRVARTKQVEIRDTANKNLAILLETADGRRQVVELGPSANLRTTPLHTGDQVTARGSHITLGQIDVLLANSANVAGTEVVIRREQPVVSATATKAVIPLGYPVAEQVQKLEGRIQHLREARLADSRQQHLVAEVVSRGGKAIVVDFGPSDQLWRADLKQGEWITIHGQEMKVDNRPVLMALEINKTGVPVLIDRKLVRGQETETVVETAAVVRPTSVISPQPVVTPATPQATVVTPVTPSTVVTPVTPPTVVERPAPIVVPPSAPRPVVVP